MRVKSHILLALAALLLLGCAVSRSPRGYRADAEHMQTDLRGGWIQVKTIYKQVLAGELLAVDADSLCVLVADGQVERLSWRSVRKARLEAWKTRTGSLIVLQSAGTLLAIGHGWWGIFTLPLWHFSASLMTGDYTFDPIVTIPKVTVPFGNWTELAPFARFPGGLPTGLMAEDLTLLGPGKEAVATRQLSVDEAPLERASARNSLLRLQEEDSGGVGRPQLARPTNGPAGLAGAWVRGELKGPMGLKPRIFAGELLAVEGDGIHLWAGGPRHLALAEMGSCKVQSAAAGTRVLTLVGDLTLQDPRRFARLSAYPKGLPSPAELQVDRDVLRAEKASAWGYLNRKSRWPK